MMYNRREVLQMLKKYKYDGYLYLRRDLLCPMGHKFLRFAVKEMNLSTWEKVGDFIYKYLFYKKIQKPSSQTMCCYFINKFFSSSLVSLLDNE